MNPKSVKYAGLFKDLTENEKYDRIKADTGTLLGTGEGFDYDDGRLDKLSAQYGEETRLFRAMCEPEYISIIGNGNKFVAYDWAMDKKWFATCYSHAKRWGTLVYPDGAYKILEITVLTESLKYMFYLKALDNIGPAYSADIVLLNKIVRRLRLV